MNKNTFILTDREVEIVYLAVQTLVQHGANNGDLKYSIETDGLRASLLNKISKRILIPSQETQQYFEENARFIASGKWDK